MAITFHPDGRVTGGTIKSTGNVIQVVNATTQTRTTVSSNTNTYYATNLTANITPSATTSKILIKASGNYYIIGGTAGGISIFKGGTNLSPSPNGSMTTIQHNGNEQGSWAIHYLDSPNSTSTLTYDVRMARLAGSDNFYIPADGNYQPIVITLMEIAG